MAADSLNRQKEALLCLRTVVGVETEKAIVAGANTQETGFERHSLAQSEIADKSPIHRQLSC